MAAATIEGRTPEAEAMAPVRTRERVSKLNNNSG